MLLPTPLSTMRSGRAFFLVSASATVFFLWQFYVLTWCHAEGPGLTLGDLSSGELANATLGFQRIIAISSEDQSSPTAWRQRGLIAAANRTGLSIDIHQSRDVSEKELQEFQDSGSKYTEKPGTGSALAWLAHHDALQYIIDNNISSALILEDDADWDVRIRSQLAPHSAIPTLLRRLYTDMDGAASPSPLNLSTATPPHPSTQPYTGSFDVLWLGHCTSLYGPHSTRLTAPNDTTQLPGQALSAYANRFAYTRLDDHERAVLSRPECACTFAYAVSGTGARRVLERTKAGAAAAFDNALGAACRESPKRGKGLRCASVAPELVHHQRGVVDADADADEEGEGAPWRGSLVEGLNRGEGEREALLAPRPSRFFTFNIMYSARCNAHRGDRRLTQCLPTEEDREVWTS
ncbi:glycosyltransferase family 25 protein [Aplosporella prunicola CBS 121167]|uniref:Glycosyltransferase family 25 protein n=1 Tax=Aplosporella prunicola CBS 121167 TaxID=1176127 RepID=A0A6A6BNX4_9PEZI|nr:glycosyltransferase family 25 protein [Aplosporella prunicola CBS 121167]KAF2145792.1 glycosyltransferase family 25 protein [Aplosporella prunicola CBS 121167]